MAIKNAGQRVYTGEALLRYVKDHPDYSRTEQCLGAGYYNDKNAPAFTEFYTALFEAKKEPTYKERIISDSIPSHDGPAIYVACLASYNKGILFGKWISLEWCTDLEELEESVQQILKYSPEPNAEEWAIHDSQCLPSFLKGEYTSLSDLNEWAEVTANVSDRDAYMIACENESRVLSEDEFSDCFYGHHSEPKHFAEEWYEGQGLLSDIPCELLYAIDWERVWDSEFDCAGYSAHYANGGYYIFGN